MNETLLTANLISMALNLGYALVAMTIGILAMKVIDRFLFPQIDFTEEIKKGNLAAAIVVGVGVLFLGMILSKSL